MKYHYKILGVYLAYLVQSLLIEDIKIFSCSPDILLTAVVICAVSLSAYKAAALGAFAGLLADVFYGHIFGVNLITYMYFALVVAIVVDERTDNSPVIMGWVCFVSLAAFELVVAVLKTFIGYSVSASSVTGAVLIKGLSGALMTFLFVFIKQKRIKRKKKTERTNEEETV